MKNILVKLHKAVLAYVVWGWPIVLIDAALEAVDGDAGDADFFGERFLRQRGFGAQVADVVRDFRGRGLGSHMYSALYIVKHTIHLVKNYRRA